MQISEVLLDIVPRYERLSKSEVKILDSLVTAKRGNAYGIWKASGLKHYPTVLRAVKKLEEKRLIQVLSESGTRGERIYLPTVFGTLLNYALKEDENRLVEFISSNSRRFQDLQQSQIMEKTRLWVFSILRAVASDVVSGISRNIDDVVKDVVLDTIRDNITNLNDPESKDEIAKLSKLEWARNLMLEEIDIDIRWCKRQIAELKKLKKTLTTK